MNSHRLARLACVMTLAVVTVGSVGCRRYKRFPLAGQQPVGDGISVRLLEPAAGKNNYIEVKTLVSNDSDYPVVVNRNQIAVVGPDGVSHYRVGGRSEYLIEPGDDHKVYIVIEESGINYKELEGLWVRFDGIWAAEDFRLQVPPMRVGNPPHDAGMVSTNLRPGKMVAKLGGQQPSERAPKRGRAGRIWDAAVGNKGGDDARADAGAAPSGGGMRSYTGRRRKIKKEGTKCAAMPLQARDVSDQMAFIVDELLLTELQNAGFEAIGPDDINAMLGFENIKEAAGCDDASCVAEIGNALGVPYLAAGSVAMLEGSTVITLKLFDVRKTKVVARVSKIADGGVKVMPQIIGEAVQELVVNSAL